MAQILYSELRNIAFQFTTDSLRKNGAKPTLNLVKRLARTAITNRINWTGDHADWQMQDTVVNDLAASIMKNWDQAKARPAPKVSRADRAVNDLKILAAIHNEGGDPRSVRDVAKLLNVSPAKVQRVRKANGLTGHAKALSDQAKAILAIADAYVPPDGMRAMDLLRLINAADIEREDAARIMEEINQSPVSTQLLMTNTRSYLGATWVVVGRGRKRTETQMLDWLARAETARVAPRRDMMRMDQRRYVVDIGQPVSNPTMRDLRAVYEVTFATRSLNYWRQYVYASIDSSPEIDRDAIVTVIQSMLRLEDADIFNGLYRAEKWVIDNNTRQICQQLFDITRHMISGVASYGYKEVIDDWCTEAAYRPRIAAGLLPGRTTDCFDAIMADYSDENEYWLFVMPEMLDQAERELLEWNDRPDIPDFLKERRPA